MTKYVVLGGFLGAGKTTTMMAFSRCMKARGRSAAILVNDLGSRDLVDGAFTRSAGYLSEDITGQCICYQTENLVDKLRRFRDADSAEMIFSDIPGCGIGALDHVYHKLNQEYPGEFDLCPFVAVADPERLRNLLPERATLNLPEEMHYLFDAQLREAEVILLNKIDLLTAEETQDLVRFLELQYPQAKVFPISARTGQGAETALDYLLENRSALPKVDIGYGGPAFQAAEACLSWYDRQLYAKRPAGGDFDGNGFVQDLAESIRERLISLKRNVPHLKVLGTDGRGGLAKLSLLGVDYPAELDQALPGPVAELRVVLNARAACESRLLSRVMEEALKETAAKYRLEEQTFFSECFGMMDTGRS